MLDADRRRADQAGASGQNPYRGPYFLTQDDRIYGRDTELAELESLLLSQRIVLLYSVSGVGKTSLLQAGLRRRLDGLDFDTVWVPGFRATTEAAAPAWSNRYETAIITHLGLGDGTRPAAGMAGNGATRLSEALDTHPSQHLLLVIDQFEELFTLDRADWPAKRAFLAELGRALTNPRRWAILALREEFLAELEAYAYLFAGDLQARLRLDPLSTEAAIKAIRGPAERLGVHFDVNLARDIAMRLAMVRVDQERSRIAYRQGDAVEPIHLQLLCHRLWTEWREAYPDATRITASDVGRLELLSPEHDLDEVFASYYNEAIAAARLHAPERTLRAWFERSLITAGGHRAPPQTPPELPSAAPAMDVLERRYVIRSMPDADTPRYELSHDRMIPAVRTANRDRLSALQPLHEMAKRWKEHLHADEYLATSAEAFRSVTEVVRKNPGLVSAEERRYFERSRARRRTKARRVALGVVGAVLAVVLLVVVLQAILEVDAKRLAEERTGKALLQWEVNPALGLQLAIDAGRDFHETTREQFPENLRSALYRFVTAMPTERVLRDDGELQLATAVASPPSGPLVATADLEGTITIRDTRDGEARAPERLDAGEQVVALDMPSDNVLASLDATGMATRWVRGRSGEWASDEKRKGVEAIAARPDGEVAVLSRGGRSVHMLRSGDVDPLPASRTGIDVAASSDRIAVVTVPDRGTPEAPTAEVRAGEVVILGGRRPVSHRLDWAPTVARYAPDGQRLVVGGQDGNLAVIEGGEVIAFPETLATSPVQSIAFADDHVITASSEGAAVWTLAPSPALVRVMRHPAATPLRLAPAASARQVIALTSTGAVEWWRVPQVVPAPSLAATPLGIVSAGDDGEPVVVEVGVPDPTGSTTDGDGSARLRSTADAARATAEDNAADEPEVEAGPRVVAGGDHVVTLTPDGALSRYTKVHRVFARRRDLRAPAQASAVAVAPTGAVAVGTTGGEVVVWRVPSAAPDTRNVRAPVTGVAWNSDGDELLVGLADGRVTLLADDEEPTSSRDATIAPVTAVARHEPPQNGSRGVGDGAWLVGRADGRVQVVTSADLDGGEDPEVQSGAVTGLAPDPAGRWVASMSGLGHASVWALTGDAVERRGTVRTTTSISAVAATDATLVVADEERVVRSFPLGDDALRERADDISSWLPMEANQCEEFTWLRECADLLEAADEAKRVQQVLSEADSLAARGY